MQIQYHVLQCGDTLQSVAVKYGVGVNELIAANPQIVNQPITCPGKVLSIPMQSDSYPGCPAFPTPEPIPMPEPLPIPEPIPTPQPNPEPSVTGGDRLPLEDQVVELVNMERERRGLQPLYINQALENVARIKSEDISNNNYFDHTSPTYGTPFQMLQRFGIRYTAAGENIAKGQTTAESVMNTWMNSSGHAANILSSTFTEIGVGYVNNNGVPVWTQMFIRP